MADPIDIGHGLVLPSRFVTTLEGVHGRSQALEWLSTLPDILDRWMSRHGLRFDQNLPDLNYNVVIFATDGNDRHVVLKLCRPWDEFLAEIQGMQELRGVETFVQLLDADTEDAALLMERVEPGTALRSAGLSDEEATEIAASLAPDIWRTPREPDKLIPLHTWFRALFREAEAPSSKVIPVELLHRAAGIADSLFADMPDPMVVHGDLHHQNILRDGDRGWMVIDQKGLLGDPAYDIATWMLNPWGIATFEDDLPALYARRLDIFERDLGLNRARMLDWAIAHSVLAASWSLADIEHNAVEPTLRCTRALLSLRD